MNKLLLFLAVGTLSMALSAIVWQHGATASEPDAATAAPTAQVRTVQARRRAMPDVVEAFGQVEPGATVGLSFAHAGQVVALPRLAGERVARGDTVAMLAPDPAVVQAWTQARSALAVAQREAARQRELLAAQLATQAQVDAADKAEADARAALQALQAEGGGDGPARLVAAFDGIVTALPATLGDRVAAGAPIAQLGRLDALRARVAVEPADATRVRAGMPVQLSAVDAAAGTAPLAARVASVGGAVDAKTRLVDVLVDLPRAAVGSAFTPGAALRARVTVDQRDLVVVPRDAVLADERGDYVFQVRDGHARRVTVTQVLALDGDCGVTGLSDLALPVVAVGNHELEDGMAVKVAAP